MTDRREILHAGLWIGLLIVGTILTIQPRMAPATLLAPIRDTIDSIEAISSTELSIGAITIGVVLIVAALGVIRSVDGDSSTGAEPAPGESPQTAEQFIDPAERSDQFRQYLREILARHGEHPDRQIRRGDWTDDPVAAATLSDEIEYPAEFRLLYWIDRQRAQNQAYERTATAIAEQSRQSDTANDRT